MNESYKKFVNYSIWVAVILFAIRCVFAKNEIGNCVSNGAWGTLLYNVFGYAGEAIGLMSLLMGLFNKTAWKWKYINKFVDMPVLEKKYIGTFVSDWKDENKTYDASLEIKQTFLNVSIMFKSEESRSVSVVSTIDTISDSKRIIYNYQNEPRAELAGRSTIHKGTVELWIEDSGELVGNYYTNRKTSGSMIFKPIS
ncbi:MAG: hypothetical protein IJI42_09505 [Methanobrevibacter sp.]|nr:hypothetical protein [Methanobrevibacter sp.]